jgi:hypothetical protein
MGAVGHLFQLVVDKSCEMTTTWTEDSIGLAISDDYDDPTRADEAQMKAFHKLIIRENEKYGVDLWITVDWVAIYPVSSNLPAIQYYESLCRIAQWIHNEDFQDGPEAVYGFVERLDLPGLMSSSGGIVVNSTGVKMVTLYQDGRISKREYLFVLGKEV